MPPALSYAAFAVATVAYAMSATLYYLEVAREAKSDQRIDRAATRLLALGALAHAGYVIMASYVTHVCPVHSVHFILSITSLLATATYLAARRRFKIHALGLLVAPVGLVVTLGTFFVGRGAPEQKLPISFIGFHVFASLVGWALSLLACGAAVMYLVQDKRLKQKRALPSGGGLPPLDALDRAVHRFLLAGFPLLTLGVITGTVWAQKLEAGTFAELLRSLLGWMAWLLVAGVLTLRVAFGWRGRRAAYGTLAGFACAAMVLLFYLVRPALHVTEAFGG
jgi:ABC-type uncharacterized transport system permease subunit